MKKSRKLYIKALDYYQNACIDKALDMCEKSISLDSKNTASINFKGLLYYFKGDIQNCKVLWKLNAQVNGDGVAEKYLETLKEDEKRLKKYTEAIKNINNLHIREGLELLYKCNESDYNCINVNNNIAGCLIKCVKYEEAQIYIEKVLNLDKNNEMALKNKKILEEYGVLKKNKKRIIYTLLIIISVCIVSLGILYAININYKSAPKKISDKAKNQSVIKPKKEETKKVKENKNEDINKNKNTDNKKEKFPLKEIKTLISSENVDYEKLYEYINKWNDKVENAQDKKIIEQAKQLMKNKGAQYFYIKGTDYLKTDKCDLAKKNYIKAYEYGKESYLYQHIIYFLGKCCQELEDTSNAIKYYKQYETEFSEGSYEETVLYELATMYKEDDIKESKKYARKLVHKYPKSQNNNSIIKEILNK